MSLKSKIAAILPEHELVEVKCSDIFIVDYKKLNRGKVAVFCQEPKDIKCVYMHNPNKIPVVFDGFKESALPIFIGNHRSNSVQCECVLFPASCKIDDWVLFIETKYTNDIKSAFKKGNNYPYGMINQILDTVKYFRDHDILEHTKLVNAIVSFPKLVEDFNSTFFTGGDSAHDILNKHKVLIWPTNSVRIKSQKKLELIQEQFYTKPG